MYLSHYHLQKEPFNNASDPSFFWRGGTHGEVIATLREGILGREGCVLLTGDIGTGKTTLMRHFVAQENIAAILLYLPDGDLNVRDFYGRLADEFEMGRGADNRPDFIARLKRVLQDSFANYRKVLIVIEDAQKLNAAVLAEAAALCDLESAGRKRLKTIFVAPLEFDEMLRREENHGVLAAITTRCRLEPLAEEETAHYIAHRLEKAGAGGQVFEADAVHEVFVMSKGFPRLINLVCEHALLYGYGSDLKVIDAGLVRDCRLDLAVALGLEEDPPAEMRRSIGDSDTGPRCPPDGTPPRRALGMWIILSVALGAVGLALALILR
jgi:general secretion pathway protein A